MICTFSEVIIKNEKLHDFANKWNNNSTNKITSFKFLVRCSLREIRRFSRFSKCDKKIYKTSTMFLHKQNIKLFKDQATTRPC